MELFQHPTLRQRPVESGAGVLVYDENWSQLDRDFENLRHGLKLQASRLLLCANLLTLSRLGR